MRPTKRIGMQFDLPPKDALGVHSEVLGSKEWVKKESLVIFAQSNQQEWIFSDMQQTLIQWLKAVLVILLSVSETKINKRVLSQYFTVIMQVLAAATTSTWLQVVATATPLAQLKVTSKVCRKRIYQLVGENFWESDFYSNQMSQKRGKNTT